MGFHLDNIYSPYGIKLKEKSYEMWILIFVLCVSGIKMQKRDRNFNPFMALRFSQFLFDLQRDLLSIPVNPLDTNVKFDAYVPTGGPFGPLLVHRDIANFRPQNKA